MSGLFAPGGARVFTVAPSASFADEVAHALFAALGKDDPLALSDALILTPNRRAGAAFAQAIVRANADATLLPTIRPLADLEDDVDVWGAEPIAFSLPSALAPLQRRFELAHLVRMRDEAQGGVADPIRAMALADELARLIDAESLVDHVDWSRMKDVVLGRDLARHWDEAVTFLEIVTQYWPQRLASDGVLDAAARRTAILRALATQWRSAPPSTPVVIAGSTGSIAATRALMAVVAQAPMGAVILPGLDREIDDAAWAAIGPQHPQYHLKLTLDHLGLSRDAVTPLARAPETARARARRVFLREALAPAPTTADWRARLDALGGTDLVRTAAEGLTLLECETEDEEATVVALLLRETLETPDRSAAFVTPDATIARRVEAKLLRWSIAPSMSIGAPLNEAPVGRLLALCCDALEDAAAPMTLAAMCAHPLARFGMARDVVQRRARALERACLRGPRRYGDLPDIVARTEGEAQALAQAIADALAPLTILSSTVDLALPEVCEALIETIEAIGLGDGDRDAIWAGDDGAAVATLLADVSSMGASLGPISLRAAARVIMGLLNERTVAPSRGGETRIAILGPLEARVLHQDLVVLGGLNEGVWPTMPPQDAFLPRVVREAIGLASPETRLGLAAHDFAQAANASEVVMTRAARQDGQPTVASRWLWRVKTLARAADMEAALDPPPARDVRRIARAMDQPRTRTPIAPPRPTPPASARPQRISFTDVEKLIRDPYEIYAKRVLGLRALDGIGIAANAGHRGTAVHRAIERFADDDDALRLVALVQEEMRRAGFEPTRVAMEGLRFEASARALEAWNAARRARGVRTLREAEARLELPSGHVLHGRADRLDFHPEGDADIIDYKTGNPASANQVETGLSPQLSLEAAVLARGGFEGQKPTPPRDLIYIALGGRETHMKPLTFKQGVAAVSDDAFERLCLLLARFAQDTTPYLSKPRVQFISKHASDYDHLARRAEWADAEGEE